MWLFTRNNFEISEKAQEFETTWREKPQEARLKEYTTVITKHPEKIPVIVFGHKTLPELAKHKFIVPREMTVGGFIHVLRQNMNLSPEKALFIFIQNQLVANSSLMTEVHHKYQSPDGFLYVNVMAENTFG
jgi:GABA(A) receptor-associated protein